MNDVMREFAEDKAFIEREIERHADLLTFWEGVKRDTTSFYKTESANRMLKMHRQEYAELTKLLEQANKVRTI